MFRKLVSNLPYCPALIGEVGFYVKRLKAEEITRRISSLFMILALILQTFAVFSPPEPANASSDQDIIRGGVSSLDDLIMRFDRNDQDIQDIYTSIGIRRSDLDSAKNTTVDATNNMFMLVRHNQLNDPSLDIPVTYQRSVGGTDVRYFSSLTTALNKNTAFEGWLGQSDSLGSFVALKSSGNILSYNLPEKLKSRNKSVKVLKKQVSITNLSRAQNGSLLSTAQPLDKIEYILSIKNSTDSNLIANFTANLSDILEYSTLLDIGGGSFAEKINVLSWPPTKIAAGETQRRSFVVKLLPEIPSIATGQSNASSFDCKMTLEFGEEASIPVNCPLPKYVEHFLAIMPSVGNGQTIGLTALFFVVITYFYIRTRQLKKEILIIRHNYNSGTL